MNPKRPAGSGAGWPTLGFALGASFLVGATAGATFAAADLVRSGGSPLVDPGGPLLVGGLLGALLALPVGPLLTCLLRRLRFELPRERLVLVLVAVFWQVTAVAALPGVLALVLLPWPWLSFLLRPGGLPLALGRLRSLALVCVGWILVMLVVGRILGGGSGPSEDPLAAAAPAGDPRPDIVLIVMDTTRADHLGAYGHPDHLTPHLDRLAREGTLYEDAISPSPWTVPSHASLFTGLFPVAHGATAEHHQWLDDRFLTLAERLAADGYETLSLVANPAVAKSNLGQGFGRQVLLYDSYEPLKLAWLARRIGAPRAWVDKGAAEAIAVTRTWLAQRRDRSRPFFLFLNLMEAHEPYLPPLPQRRSLLPAGADLLGATRVALRFDDIAALASQVGIRDQPEDAGVLRSLYAAGVAYQDEQLGRLFAELRAATDFDRTLLIVTADHGENLGDGRRWGHLFAINDQLLRVPLIIRHPALFPMGLRVRGMAQLVDVVPTILRVLGRDSVDGELPGRSLVPADFAPRSHAFAQFSPLYSLLGEVGGVMDRGLDLGRLASQMRAVRTGSHKYVWYSNGERVLYDLRNDPDETINVIGQHRATARELDRALATWWEEQPHYAPEEQGSAPVAEPLSPAERERLRAIGYIR